MRNDEKGKKGKVNKGIEGIRESVLKKIVAVFFSPTIGIHVKISLLLLRNRTGVRRGGGEGKAKEDWHFFANFLGVTSCFQTVTFCVWIVKFFQINFSHFFLSSLFRKIWKLPPPSRRFLYSSLLNFSFGMQSDAFCWWETNKITSNKIRKRKKKKFVEFFNV